MVDEHVVFAGVDVHREVVRCRYARKEAVRGWCGLLGEEGIEDGFVAGAIFSGCAFWDRGEVECFLDVGAAEVGCLEREGVDGVAVVVDVVDVKAGLVFCAWGDCSVGGCFCCCV